MSEQGRQKAQRRFDELWSEANAEFSNRPFVERGAARVNPRAFSPEILEKWYSERGVTIRVVGEFLKGMLTEVVELAPHACQECGHVGGRHREGCICVAEQSGWISTSKRKPDDFRYVQFHVPGVKGPLVGRRESSDQAGDRPWEDCLSADVVGDCDTYSDEQVLCWRELAAEPGARNA